MNDAVHIKLIGVGGIGTSFLSFMTRYFAYQESRAVELILVDGDSFEARNRERQAFPLEDQGNKAEVKARELRAEFTNVTIRAIPEYVTPDNVRDIIQRHDIVLLAVDNHATRKLVSRRCKELWDVTLISGGNDLVDGSVMVHVRKGRENLTNPIEMHHPEIMDPQDVNPGVILDCMALAADGEPQLIPTNMAAALGMACALYQILTGVTPAGETYFDITLPGIFRARERRVV